MSSSSADGAQLIRRGLSHCDETVVLTVVDQLNLHSGARVDVLVVAPLRTLRKNRSVEQFAATAPFAAVRFLAELIANEPLERVVEILGDASADPSFDQLAHAVDQLLSESVAPSVIALMLAVAAADEVPAEAHCRALLSDRPEFTLPEIVVSAPASPLINPRTVDPAVKEERRRRREEHKQSRQRQLSRPPSRPAPKAVSSRPSSAPPVAAAVSTTPEPVPEFARRRVLLTPLESAEFSTDHPLAGLFVELDVPYSGTERDDLAGTSKRRPVVVLAGSPEALLVRPVFSKPDIARAVLVGWSRLGLDHVSYVALERVRVAVDTGGPIRTFGRLTDEEWNSLL